jgi:Family of unknown function (DUF6065)
MVAGLPAFDGEYTWWSLCGVTAERRVIPGVLCVAEDLFSQTWVPWEAYGLAPTDIEGWSFSRGALDDRDLAVRAASELSLTVFSPVGFTVDKGILTVAGPTSWRPRIRLADGRLILRLPLTPRGRVLVLPPAEPLPPRAECRIAAYDGTGGEIEVIWKVDERERLDVQAGQALCRVVALSGALRPELIDDGSFTLRVWRLHPQGVAIHPAERTLRGDASLAAVRWCGPFIHANAYGFWVFPPVDMDVVWHGGRSFEHRFLSQYTDDDLSFVGHLQRPGDRYRYKPRKKVEFGSAQESVMSVWTGCIFQTPPGWSLMVRDPVNINTSAIFRAQDAILETDWLPYDVWLNLLFVQQGKWARLRRSDAWPPIAQLLPVPTAAYDHSWRLIDGAMERTTAEGDALFGRWIDYNAKKWGPDGQKEPATYHRERRRRRPEG